jgi:hypothetical protein
MGVIAVGDIVELQLRALLYDQVVINVFHYRLRAAGADMDYQDNIEALRDTLHAGAFKTDWLALNSTDYSLRTWRVQRVAPARNFLIDLAVVEAGTFGGGNKTANTSAVITKRTDRVGNHTKGVHTYRGATGEVHIPALAPTMMTAGNVTDAYRALMDTFGGQMATPAVGFLGAIWDPVLWHRDARAAVNYDVITHWFSQQTIRVMRRRTVGLGI